MDGPLGKYVLTIRRQFQYVIVFSAYGGATLVNNLNCDFFPNKGNVLQKCFELLLKTQDDPHQNYLFIGN